MVRDSLFIRAVVLSTFRPNGSARSSNRCHHFLFTRAFVLRWPPAPQGQGGARGCLNPLFIRAFVLSPGSPTPFAARRSVDICGKGCWKTPDTASSFLRCLRSRDVSYCRFNTSDCAETSPQNRPPTGFRTRAVRHTITTSGSSNGSASCIPKSNTFAAQSLHSG